MLAQRCDLAQPGPPQIWHHRIHQRWAGEDLFFWRLAFFPRYDRKEILETIRSVMTDNGVLSFAIYEALGLFDLFIRAWLPSQASEKVERALGNALDPESIQLLEAFSVTRVLRNHAWEAEGSDKIDPDRSVLDRPLPDHVIERLNSGQIPSDERAQLREDCVLASLYPGEGIQFFTIVASATLSTNSEIEGALRNELLKRVRESGIREPAVYEGTGFGQYIVTGRADPSDVFAITRLFTSINSLVLEGKVMARPYTHVCAHSEPLFFADRLPLMQAARPHDLEALLRSGESQVLAIRGSLGTDLARWLSEGEMVSSEKIIDDGVIKIVVGMLNADGGQVVIGAIDRNATVPGGRADDHPRLKGLPLRGEYICLGVNDEYGDEDWEAFRVKLNDLLAAKIQPPPAGAISISRETVDGTRDIWVIRVQPARATWFYRVLSETGPVNFFVRRGAGTISYAGIEADAYKRQRQRG